ARSTIGTEHKANLRRATRVDQNYKLARTRRSTDWRRAETKSFEIFYRSPDFSYIRMEKRIGTSSSKTRRRPTCSDRRHDLRTRDDVDDGLPTGSDLCRCRACGKRLLRIL